LKGGEALSGLEIMTFPDYYPLVPEAEIKARLKRMGQALEGLAEAALFSWPADLFYLTGSNQMGYLVLAPDQEPLFLVRRSPDRARAESPVRVAPLDGLSDLGQAVKSHLGRFPQRLGLTLDVVPAREAGAMEDLLDRPQVIDLAPWLLNLRSVKSQWEVEQMAQAGRIGKLVFAQLPALFSPGMSELALAGALFKAATELGSQGFMRTRAVGGEMYPWHVVAGLNGLRTSRLEAAFGGLGVSPSFPQGPSLEPIKPQEPVLVDFGTCFLGYQVDVTRMFSWGRPPARSAEALEALKKIEADLLKRLVPGADGAALFDRARTMAGQLGFDREFLGQGRSRTKFVGHGVGLEISEPPFLASDRRETLEENQTLALELKMVIPGQGAVGLENTVLVTGAGGQKLTPAAEDFADLCPEG